MDDKIKHEILWIGAIGDLLALATTAVEQISVRIDEKTIKLVIVLAKSRGEQLSDFVRRSIRKELASLGYLDDSEMKALGLNS